MHRASVLARARLIDTNWPVPTIMALRYWAIWRGGANEKEARSRRGGACRRCRGRHLRVAVHGALVKRQLQIGFRPAPPRRRRPVVRGSGSLSAFALSRDRPDFQKGEPCTVGMSGDDLQHRALSDRGDSALVLAGWDTGEVLKWQLSESALCARTLPVAVRRPESALPLKERGSAAHATCGPHPRS
jgi:hypothetical protein